MAVLIAKGQQEGQVWRQKMPESQTIVLGRASEFWNVPWEPSLSRRHAELTWENQTLTVHRLPEATNPIWYRGEKANSFSVKPGETFVIGETVWTIEVGGEGSISTGDSREILHAFTISPENLRQVPFRDAPHRLDVLGHLAKVIESAPNETELLEQAVNLLLDGIRKADVTCIIELDECAPESGVRVLSSVHRTVAGPFQPSSRLAKKAILFEQQSVVHVWTSKQEETGQMFTLMGNFDWSFCTPLHGPGGKGLAIYVAGRLQGASPASALAPWSSNDLTEDVKFAELVAAIVSALRQSSYLQHRQGILGHFFSPSVLRIVSASDPETALKPRDAEVTVLFCDLRGFSKKVELEAEHLNEILERVSMALGVMTKSIHDHGGVVADFLGDCAMAFWGWPLSHDDDVQQACKAALDIQSEFQRFSSDPAHPLAGFRAGVGLATGHAVAGQIGSRDQAKVTVFGPVVNLASRLEGLTKILRVPILIDETTAKSVKTRMPVTIARTRRLARIRPYGLIGELDVSELMHPMSKAEVLTDQHLEQYEKALKAFLEGNWTDAYELLHSIPPQDLGKDLLISYILQHNHNPPANWDGVIPMQSKS
ncbi:MAG: adenylate/guanylate cyclase domain-containing protein [Verrucomicrobia bacterium]|nr:adenylate/guanylate cyclase domain-containing protein [Verrucomicrobiota bacterium]